MHRTTQYTGLYRVCDWLFTFIVAILLITQYAILCVKLSDYERETHIVGEEIRFTWHYTFLPLLVIVYILVIRRIFSYEHKAFVKEKHCCSVLNVVMELAVVLIIAIAVHIILYRIDTIQTMLFSDWTLPLVMIGIAVSILIIVMFVNLMYRCVKACGAMADSL